MKKIFSILILSLVVAFPNFCIDPPLVDSLDNEFIIIGSFMIHMSQITEDNFKAASLTITDTQKIYYKSKFADGTWFRVDEGVEIKDVILKGNTATMKSDYMDNYFKFTLMIEADGNQIKFGDAITNSNPRIVTLESLIKEKDQEIVKMMAQVKGDINDPSNEAIVSEVAQLNYDKSLFENFDDKTTIKKQAIKEKLSEIEKAKEDNNIKLEYELYNELEELDKNTFNKESKLELLLTSLEDIESLNDLKTKFLANGFEKLVEELDIELASKKEVVDDLSSKVLAQNIKDILSGGLSEDEKSKIISMNNLINKRMKEASASAETKVLTNNLENSLENILSNISESLINSEAGMSIKTGKSLITDLLTDGSIIASKLNSILDAAGGDIGSKIQKDNMTIDLIKNKSETLLLDLKSGLDKVDKFYEIILGEDFDSKTNIIVSLDKSNKLLISKLEELGELEKLKRREVLLNDQIKKISSELNTNISELQLDETRKIEKEKILELSNEEVLDLKEQILIITSNLELDNLVKELMIRNEELMLEKTKLDLNNSEVDAVKDTATEIASALRLVNQKELLEDERLNDLITEYDLKTDIDNLSAYNDELVAMLNRKYEAEFLKLLKERYYLIKDYNSDKKKIYNQNLVLYTSRIKEIDLELHRYTNLRFVDKEISYIRYEYWLAVISKDFDKQTEYLKIINEYKNINQEIDALENLNSMNLRELADQLKKLNFEATASELTSNLIK